jgi:lysophospholipase L1-like esterase
VSARRVALALVALLAVAAGGGGAGWGLRQARASTAGTPAATPAPRATTTPTVRAVATPTPQPPPGAPPARKPERVVLVGDSHSYGAGLEPPRDLPSLLRGLRPDLDVIGMGVGGQESRDALARLRQFRLVHADEAVVWLGGQDADDGVAVRDFRDTMEQLIAGLAPARIVLVTPIADYSVDPRLYVPFAAATRDLAAEHGLTLIDMGSFPRSAYQDDGVHLDAPAEVQVAQRYAKAL